MAKRLFIYVLKLFGRNKKIRGKKENGVNILFISKSSTPYLLDKFTATTIYVRSNVTTWLIQSHIPPPVVLDIHFRLVYKLVIIIY